MNHFILNCFYKINIKMYIINIKIKSGNKNEIKIVIKTRRYHVLRSLRKEKCICEFKTHRIDWANLGVNFELPGSFDFQILSSILI